MGMFSEIHAYEEAKSTARILRKVKSPFWIWAYPFASTFLFPLYENQCSEAWSTPDIDLIKFYRPFRRIK